MSKVILPEPKETKAGMEVDVDFSYTSGHSGLECVICSNPYIQPLQLHPCEHVMCHGCCKLAYRSTSTCCECRTEIESVSNAPRLFVGLLDALEVRCCKCNLVASRGRYENHECTPKPVYEICLEWGKKLCEAGKYDAAVAEFSKRINAFEGTVKLSTKKAKGPDVAPLYKGRSEANLKLKQFASAIADATAYIKWCTTCGLDVSGSVYYIRACAQYEGLKSPKKEALSPKDLDSIVGDLKEAIRRSPDDSLGAKGLLAHLHVEPSPTSADKPAVAPPAVPTPPVSAKNVAAVETVQGCADFVLHNSITMLRTYFKQFGKEALAAYEALSPKDREFSLRRTEPFIVPRAGATLDISGEDCHVVAHLCPEININGLCVANGGLEILMSYYGNTSVTSKTMSALIYESVQKVQESIEAPGTARYEFVKSHVRECPVVDAKTGEVCNTVIDASSKVEYEKRVMDLMRNKKELLWVPSYHRELAVDRLTTLIDFLLRVLVNSAPYVGKTISKPVSNVFGCLECGAKHHDASSKLVAPPVVCHCSIAYYCSKACMSKCEKSHTPICHMGAELGFEDLVRKVRNDMNDSMPLIDDKTTRTLYAKYCNAKKNASDMCGDGDQTLLPQIRSVTCDSQKLRAAWASGLDFNPRVFNNTELFKKAYLGDDKGVKRILDAIKSSSEKKDTANFRETHMRFSPLHSCIAGARGKEVHGGGDFVAIARMLIEAGANVDAKDFLGFSCVHHCTSSYATDESLQILLLLGEAGANANAKNRLDEYALLEPTQAQRVEIVKALMQIGADPNMKGCYGMMTAMACARMSTTMQQLLFTCQAIANLQVGDKVILQNIQSKPHLNNTSATVTGRTVGKYQIKLDSSDDEIVVKMENLRRASAEGLCNACKKHCEAPKRCGRCKAVVYCGEECQKKDWSVHKATCAPPADTSDIVVPKLTGPALYGMDMAKSGIRKSSKKVAEGTFMVKIQVQLDLSTMKPLKGTGVRIYNRDQSLDWCLRPGESVPVDINTRLFDFVCSKGISGIKAYATAKYSKQTGSLTITPVALPLPDW